MKRILAVFVLLLTAILALFAQVPRIITHQGFLTDKSNGQPLNGTYQIRFRIYTDSTGSTQLWTQLFSSVQVTKGAYSVNLSVGALAFSSSCFLQTEVSGEILTPRTRLTSAPYSIRSDSTDNVVSGKVVKSLNGLRDNITLSAGSNVTITPSGSTLTIASAGGGGTMALPYTGSVADNSQAFSITNTGLGTAGRFQTNNANNTGAALFAGAYSSASGSAITVDYNGGGRALNLYANGTGDGIYVQKDGAGGTGGYFSLTHPSNTNPALHGVVNGPGNAIYGLSTGTGGRAGRFQINNANNNNTALMVESNGTGTVLSVFATSTTANSAAIAVQKSSAGDAAASYSVGGTGLAGYSSGSGKGVSGYTNGNGYGMYGSVSGSGVAVGGYTTGSGRAGRFEVDNPSNGVTGLISYHNGSGHAMAGVNSGTGRAGHFEVNSPTSNAAALYATTAGDGGSSGYFLTTNAANGAPAIYSRTVGSGNALQAVTFGTGSAVTISVVNTGNTAPALSVTTTGTGLAAEFVGRVSLDVLQINGGSDLAEPFTVEDGESEIEPGTVVIIDDKNSGNLLVSQTAYDTRVAGIVSGAGGVKPGLTLQQENVMIGKSLVAMAGRVYCKADVSGGEIKPGDLLTTSSLSGSAMKATDRERSHGAIIGKAMSSLKEGSGLVLVLVNLH